VESDASRHQLSEAQRLRRNELIAEALRRRKSRLGAIRVFFRDGNWLVDYGSYAHGYHLTRAEAIETATRNARDEGRDLVVEPGPDDPSDKRSVESRFS
jgi:hypothetical protein